MRLFIAITPPDEIRNALAVQQFFFPVPRKEPSDNLHLRLAFLDEVAADRLEPLADELSFLHMPPFTLSLRGFGLFGKSRPRAVWADLLPSPPLEALAAKVAHAAHRAGVGPAPRRFRPHVTLARFAPLDPAQAAGLERAVIAGAGFSAGPWPVEAFGLYRSYRHADGARYELLAEFPLG